jgi:putative ABC transport system permease protein
MRRTRTGILAVVCLIAIAVALGIAVSSQERALRKGSARAADGFDLLIGSPGSQTELVLSTVYLQPAVLPLLPGDIIKHLQEETGAVYFAPIAFGDSYQGYAVVGSSSAFVTQAGLIRPAEGRVFEAIREVVIGADVRLRLGETFVPLHGQSRPGESGSGDEGEAGHKHEGFRYTVVGRMPRQGNPWDRAIIAPVEAVWRLHGLGTGHAEGKEQIGPPWEGGTVPDIPVIVVKPRSVADAYRLRAKYRTATTMALFPAEVLVQLHSMLGDARDLLAVVSVATQTLVIAAVLLAVFASLAMRRRQLAVLRALGASRNYVFLVIWLHVSLMTIGGTAAGVVLGWSGAYGLSHLFFLKTGIELPVSLGMEEIRMGLALIGVGFILALVPSWSGYRQSVSSNLKA